MSAVVTFDGVLDAIEQLSPDDQEAVMEVVKRRLAERRRQQLLEDVREARAEHARGESRPMTVDEIMAAAQS
ncbi:MAG: hypothetical protein SH850_26145 [Planctomycetaceae bacterium]|nr:hypothetical protein [Planctomycetaceae bacterium]